MVEHARGARLLLEAPQAVGVSSKGRRKNFNGYLAPQARVAGAVDFPHPTRTERREDFVRAKPSSGNQGHRLCIVAQRSGLIPCYNF